MSRQTISALLLAGAVGFVAYLAYIGVTVNSACAWVERQTGVRLKNPELRNVPHPAYSPVVLPGR